MSSCGLFNFAEFVLSKMNDYCLQCNNKLIECL